MGIKVAKRIIAISNPNKIWFPKSKITKGEILDYYSQMAGRMNDLVKNHLITVQRFPEGIMGENFYQKNTPEYFPSWIKRFAVKKEDGQLVHYIVAQDPAAIVYVANQGAIVLHAWLARYDKLEYPDRMIFDLDPSVNDFSSVRKAALLLKDMCDELQLPSYVMSTGSKGLHVCIPLKRVHTFDQVGDYALAIAQKMLEHKPKQFTLEIRKNKRDKKIFIDTLRNRYNATSVVPYSVRAIEKAPVATPLHWEEIKDVRLTPQKFTIKNIFKRLETIQDPWHDFYDTAVSLKKSYKRVVIHE